MSAANPNLPTAQQAMDDWARGVLPLKDIESTLAIADKINALEGIVDDPTGECEAALARVGGNGSKPVAMADALSPIGDIPAPQPIFIDWPTFWARDHSEAEWVYADVLARGRGHAVYAAHKQGKSLLMLNIAAALATGPEPIVACYFDYEMSEADVFDRLEDMGYGPDTDLSRLYYALLPALPPLDTAAGADALTDLLDRVQGRWPEHHLVVTLDTISRAVSGEENSADTFRAFYCHTGIELKRRGITWVRLDHAGHQADHQRGSSSKGDDVDVVWKLTRTDNGVRLTRELSRMSWVPATVTFGEFEDPLRFTRLTDDWPEGTGELANILDRLEVPLEASYREARAALKTIDESRRHALVLAALRQRRDRLAGGAS